VRRVCSTPRIDWCIKTALPLRIQAEPAWARRRRTQGAVDFPIIGTRTFWSTGAAIAGASPTKGLSRQNELGVSRGGPCDVECVLGVEV